MPYIHLFLVWRDCVLYIAIQLYIIIVITHNVIDYGNIIKNTIPYSVSRIAGT